MRFSLVRTAMSAPTEAYAGHGETAEHAAARVVRALEDRPVTVDGWPGRIGELLNIAAPRLSDALFSRAERMFSDSAAARGEALSAGVGRLRRRR